tara:strand:- start:2354 stop:3202 length:849 start_codon:yes stop_codon:yes gene_type:complete
MTKKILIVGGGFLGKNISKIISNIGLTPIVTHVSNGQSNLDIRNIRMIEESIERINPHTIINCAASTNIDEIELNPETAFDVNSNGASNLATIANRKNIKFLHISTDGIFSGIEGNYDEKDEPNPVNKYAQSKKLGEKLIQEQNKQTTIIRTNFYGYDEYGNFLFNWVLNNLKQKKQFTAFSDVIFNPLEISNLSEMIVEIMQTDFYGIIHMAGNEIFSKYQFAQKIAQTLKYDSNLIISGSVCDSDLIAQRPLNTTLSNTLAKSILKTKINSLEEWLQKNF